MIAATESKEHLVSLCIPPHRLIYVQDIYMVKLLFWLSGRVLDSRLRGPGFEPHLRHCVVVLEQDTFVLAQYWFNPGRPVPV